MFEKAIKQIFAKFGRSAPVIVSPTLVKIEATTSMEKGFMTAYLRKQLAIFSDLSA